MKQRILKRKLDLLLLALSVICFGLFIFNAVTINFDNSGVASPIAIIKKGDLDRKRNGNLSFTHVSTNDALFNRDLIWVGPRGYAEIEFEDRTRLALHENTLLFLRRIPRQNTLLPLAEVLKGSVEELKSPLRLAPKKMEVRNVSTPPPSTAEPSAPSPAKKSAEPAATPAPELTAVHPLPNSILGLVKKKEGRVAFSWNLPFSGTLVLKNAKGAELHRVALKDQKFIYLNLAGQRKYQWQLIDSNNTPALGPFGFELKELTPQDLKQFLFKQKNTGTGLFEILN